MPRHRADHPEALSPDEHATLADSLATEARGLPLRRTDLHTRATLRLMRERFAEWSADPPGPRAVRVPVAHGPLATVDVLPGILAVPEVDEDWGPAPFAKRAGQRAFRALPVVDDDDAWPSHAEALATINAELSAIEPLPTVRWADTTSDRAIRLLAFQGLGAHRLEPVEPGVDPDGAAWTIDLSWMHGLPVRPGLEPYGACAYFAPDRALQRIYTSHDDRTHRPGDAGWEDAKWRWKCALFTAVTVADHLGSTHLLAANLMVTATREHLPADHPLRRLLKPFEFRTVAINYDASLGLAPEGGLAHRAFAFTYDGVARCLLHALHRTRFETFPQLVARMRVAPLGDGCPFATDGLALYAVLRAYVAEYAAIYFPGEALARDPAVRAFWQGLVALAPSVGFGPLERAAQVLDVVTQFVFTVTGLHEHVGGVAEYVLDPGFMGGKIRAGRRMADVQATVQVLVLLAATGFKQPPLCGDYAHLFLDRERPRAVAAFERYQQALAQLSRDIEARNRGREQPYHAFDPRILQSSVSI